MSSPRYSLRFLFYAMTAVAVLATLTIYFLQLPGNLKTVFYILAAVSLFLLVGVLVSAATITPTGYLVANLAVTLILIVESYAKYCGLRDTSKSFVSWDGMITVFFPIGATCICWQSFSRFRSLKAKSSPSEE